ncbi:hypothetical protein SAMN05216431_11421 [Ligilactobacillus sp. WC1T17]|uniref:Uncharacterized protein n=1 Tax=Ligilactobacillus ruminis TaxID=1623 RepID=A0ABY1ADK5_9LACO|nr:hypothetical protein SAMN05216431_11421 [Ligilactobacillus ruminis]
MLILGATSNTGRLAIEISRYLGAKEVVGLGRKIAVLQSLGLDDYVVLDGTMAEKMQKYADFGVDLDYLWGQPALDLMGAMLQARKNKAALLEWVQIGNVTGKKLLYQPVAV